MNPHFELDSYIYDAFGKFFYEHTTLFDASHALIPMQPVGYHFFVGLVYKLFGPGIGGIIFVQTILAGAILFLTYTIAKRVSTQRSAFIALGLCATNIGLIVYTQLLLAEILLTFVCMLFWERMLAADHEQSRTRLAVGIFFLSCSVLVKPIALLFFVPLILFVWRWYGIRVASLCAGIFYAPIGAYMLRNWYLYNAFAFAPMMHVNLYQCFLSKVIAKVEGCSIEHVLQRVMPQSSQLFDPHLWDVQRELLWNYVINNPGACFTVWCANVGKTMFGLFTTQLKIFLNPAVRGGATAWSLVQGSGLSALVSYLWFGTTSWFVFLLGCVEMIWNCVRLFLIGCGIMQLRSQQMRFVLLASVFCVCTIFATGVDGCFRYRMPCEPLLCIFAAVGIDWLMCMIAQSRRRVYGLILAGGSGERLWPISSAAKPKQFLTLGSHKTLLEQTVERMARVVPQKNLVLVTNQVHAALCTMPIQKIIEPISRNTAPALMLACMQQEESNSVLVITPADAFIPESEYGVFVHAIEQAVTFAMAHDRIVLLGVKPTYAATGYGYIEYISDVTSAVHTISRFHEKPVPSLAQHYYAQENMLWNIGIFIAKAHVILAECEQHAPDIYHAVQKYMQGTGSYESIAPISIDYAVIEKSKRLSVLPVSFSWCDVGTLASFVEMKQAHEVHKNNVVHINSEHSLVDAPGMTVALIDADDLCVVKRDNVLVISRRTETEKVRTIAAQLKQNGMMDHI